MIILATKSFDIILWIRINPQVTNIFLNSQQKVFIIFIN